MNATTLALLLVWPNPFHTLDHEGRPNSVLPIEPTGDGRTTFDPRAFVGARLNANITQRALEGTAQQNMQRTWFEYEDVPTKVPNTAYYRHAIARGEIFAADEETAAKAGIVDTFVEADELLEAAKKEAIDAYERNPPHEDLDGLAPFLLTNFSFGPMKDAVANRKKLESEAKKREEIEKKAADKAAKEQEDALALRKKQREERDKKILEEMEKAKVDAAKADVEQLAAVQKAEEEKKKKAADEAARNKPTNKEGI